MPLRTGRGSPVRSGIACRRLPEGGQPQGFLRRGVGNSADKCIQNTQFKIKHFLSGTGRAFDPLSAGRNGVDLKKTINGLWVAGAQPVGREEG